MNANDMPPGQENRYLHPQKIWDDTVPYAGADAVAAEALAGVRAALATLAGAGNVADRIVVSARETASGRFLIARVDVPDTDFADTHMPMIFEHEVNWDHRVANHTAIALSLRAFAQRNQ